MHEPEPLLTLRPILALDDDDDFPEPSDEELLREESDLEDDLEPIDDEGYDISEFDDDDEGELYGDDDDLFIAGDDDLPDDPDDDDEDDEDEDDVDDDLDDENGWFLD